MQELCSLLFLIHKKWYPVNKKIVGESALLRKILGNFREFFCTAGRKKRIRGRERKEWVRKGKSVR